MRVRVSEHLRVLVRVQICGCVRWRVHAHACVHFHVCVYVLVCLRLREKLRKRQRNIETKFKRENAKEANQECDRQMEKGGEAQKRRGGSGGGCICASA